MPLRPFPTIALALAFLASLQAMAETLPEPRAAGRAMSAAVAERDAQGIAALYLPKAILLGPGQPAVVGHAAIQALWEANFAAGFRNLSFSDIAEEQGTDRAAVLWTWAAEIGPAGQPAHVLRGRSLLYFTLTPEGWRITADMWQPVP